MLKYKGSNSANGAILIWKSSLSKVNTILNYYILTGRTYIILISIGDLIGPLLSTKATTKCI